jgi:hypothetical protein
MIKCETPADWAAALGWHIRSVRRAARQGRFPGRLPTGRRMLWPAGTITRFMSGRAAKK